MLQSQGNSGSWKTWTIQQDYHKKGSFPTHYQLAWAAPAPFLHPGTLRWLAKQRHGQDRQPKCHGCYSCSQNWPHSCKPLQQGEGGSSASARRGTRNTTPRTAATRPQGTHSNQPHGEAASGQFSVSAVSVRSIKPKAEAVTPARPHCISGQCSAWRGLPAVQRQLCCSDAEGSLHLTALFRHLLPFLGEGFWFL